jgi:hydroxyacylglutathione hydrolase
MAGDLPYRLGELPHGRPVAVICASGFRASIGASLLRASGRDEVSWVAEGTPAWEAAGYPIER